MLLKSILFVDDEQYILDGLKRRLGRVNHDWSFSFACGGREALQILKRNSFDVVVTDIRMPELNGIELLRVVRDTFPDTVRIALTGDVGQNLALDYVGVTHQFINKPVDVDKIKNLLQQICSLRDMLGNECFIKTATRLSDLPSLPSLYQSVISELQAAEPSIKQIAGIIGQDLAMTAKILQIVNSAFFGLPNKVANINQAVTLLGLDTIKALVLFSGIFTALKTRRNALITPDALWEHSIRVAKLAQKIYLHYDNSWEPAEETLVAGFLHDIGLIIIMQMDYIDEITQYTRLNHCPFIDAEYHIMGVSHAEIGAYLLGIWGFSDNIIEAAAFHHHPGRAGKTSFDAISAVHAADSFLSPEFYSFSGDFYHFVDKEYLESIDMLTDLSYWEGIMRDSVEQGG